jgi:hypothetical protein
MLAVAAVGCGGTPANDRALKTALATVCNDAAGGLEPIGNLYGETTLSRRDLDALGGLADDLDRDANALDDVPVVKSDVPDLAPVARRLGERARAVVAATEQTPISSRTLFLAEQELVDGLAGIPRAPCAGTALASRASRTAMRDLAIEIRCLHVGRLARILERFGAGESDSSGKDLDETADGLAVASRSFGFAADDGQAATTLELSGLVTRWADLTRRGESFSGLLGRGGELVRGFGICPDF